MSQKLAYHITADRPAAKLWLEDDDGTLIDFSTGYTFTLLIGDKGSAAKLTKASGITGAAGSGKEPTGVPNVTVTWSAGEIAASSVVAGQSYVFELTARATGSLDRVFEGMFEVRRVVLAAS